MKTSLVELKDIGSNYSVSGTVTAKKKTTLSFRVPGFIETMNVDRGDYVSAGTVIAQLDKRDYAAELELAEAELKSAKLSFERAQADFQKIEGLFKGQTTSQQEFERAETDLRLAETAITEARTKRDLAKRRVEYTKLASSYECGIVELHAREGEFVDAGHPVVSICSLDPLTVEVGIPDSEIVRINKGDAARVMFSSLPSAEFTGTVESIGPVADSLTRTFPVEVSIENTDMKIKPGMIAWVELTLSTATEAVTIPLAAVVKSEEGSPVVYVVDNTNPESVKARTLKLGRAFGKEIEVLEGVSVGEEIVVAGQHYLTPGQKINKAKQEISSQ